MPAAADTVESMASHRPYRPALGIKAAQKEIQAGSGKACDPEVAPARRRSAKMDSVSGRDRQVRSLISSGAESGGERDQGIVRKMSEAI